MALNALTRLKRPGNSLVHSTTKRLRTLRLKDDLASNMLSVRNDTVMAAVPRPLRWIPDPRTIDTSCRADKNMMPRANSLRWINHSDVPNNETETGGAKKGSPNNIQVATVITWVPSSRKHHSTK